MNIMIYIASDHRGFELKEKIKSYLLEKGFEIEDCGALEFNKDDDYPDFVAKASQKTSEDPQSFGIVFGKSGAGECITANKIKNVRVRDKHSLHDAGPGQLHYGVFEPRSNTPKHSPANH